MNRKTKVTGKQPETWIQRLMRCVEEDRTNDGGLWAKDSVAAYQLYLQALNERLTLDDLPKSMTEKLQAFLKTLAHHVAEDLHQINAEDTRLTLAERENVMSAQRRHKAEIPEDRMRELIEYVGAIEPMTDTELRQDIIENRIKANMPALTEEELTQQVSMVNAGPCSMWKNVDPKVNAMTVGEKIAWIRARWNLAPRTREEQDFVDALKRQLERQKMNALSVKLVSDDHKIEVAAQAAVRAHMAQAENRVTTAPFVAIINDGKQDMALTVNGVRREIAPAPLAVLAAVVRGYSSFMADCQAGRSPAKPCHFKHLDGRRVGCHLEEIIKRVIPDRVRTNATILENPANLFRVTAAYPETKTTYHEMLGNKGQATFRPILFRTEP
jgi:hypothetical protein